MLRAPGDVDGDVDLLELAEQDVGGFRDMALPVCAPLGETEPLAPAEAVTVYVSIANEASMVWPAVTWVKE